MGKGKHRENIVLIQYDSLICQSVHNLWQKHRPWCPAEGKITGKTLSFWSLLKFSGNADVKLASTIVVWPCVWNSECGEFLQIAFFFFVFKL